tara:strand:+ start:8041 stop:8199 length:159 start_codon:yes stop_codon:yes gene_type:complete
MVQYDKKKQFIEAEAKKGEAIRPNTPLKKPKTPSKKTPTGKKNTTKTKEKKV